MLLPAGYLGIRSFGLVMRSAAPHRTGRRDSLLGSWVLRPLQQHFRCLRDVCLRLAGLFPGITKRAVGTTFILGMILGPLVEDKLRAGLVSTGGDILPMFTQPICLGLISAAGGNPDRACDYATVKEAICWQQLNDQESDRSLWLLKLAGKRRLDCLHSTSQA